MIQVKQIKLIINKYYNYSFNNFIIFYDNFLRMLKSMFNVAQNIRRIYCVSGNTMYLEII